MCKKSSFTPQIVTFGNALTDVLTQIETDAVLDQMSLPKGGMVLLTEEKYAALEGEIKNLPLKVATGGSAANTALCLAHLGARVGYIGKLNEADRFGGFFATTFREAGVQLTVVPATEGKASGVCTAFVSPDGERTFATYLGAAADLQPEELTADMFSGAQVVHIEGYLVQNHDLILRAVQLVHASGALVSLDLASFNIVAADHDFFHQLLPEVDIVFANEEEAAAWLPGTPEQALHSLAQICGLAVVKVGAKGAWAERRGGESPVFCAAEPVVHVTDTTAAGDFFAAGFLYALQKERSLADCLHAGAYCASRVIQVMGTALTPEMWAEIADEIA